MKRLSVIAILLLLGGFVGGAVVAVQPFTTLSNVLGSSQVAGTKHPLHVMLIDEAGAFAEIEFTGDVTVNDVGITTFASGGITGTIADLTNSNPLATMIVDGAGTQITSFGGGTQYTEGDTDATITGTALMWEDAANTLRTSSAANPFPVTVISGGGGGTQYAVDTALGATPTGTLAVAIRDDTLSTLTPVEGDAVGLRVTSTGALWAHVTGTGAFDVQITGGALTALALIDNIVSVEDAVAGSAFSGVGFLAVRQDAHVDLAADGDFIPPTIDADGGLRVSIVNGSVGDTELSAAAAASDNFANPTSGGVLAFNMVWDGSTWDRATPSLLTEATEDSAETANGVGTYAMGVRRDTPASSAGASGDNTMASYNAVGALYTAPGGATVHYRTAAGSTEDEHEIKATAGILYSVLITNTNAAVRYIRCYNLTAANTTPGTSTVFWGGAIPGAAAGAGFVYTFPSGLTFDTALTCAWTTGAADSDVAEVAANEIKATYTYR